MKKKVLLSAIMSVVTLTVTADEYIDPQTNVVYTYEPGQTSASVKAGYEEFMGMGHAHELESVHHPGSPDAAGDVVILDRFTVGTDEYVVTSIGEGAFRENGNIKSISIPESVKDIGAAAFASCNSLATVQLPIGLTHIGPELFRGSIQLASVIIPSSVSTIDCWAFGGCTSLTDLTLPESLTFVGRYAFYDTPWYAAQYNEATDGPFYIGPILFGYKGDKPMGELTIKEGTTCIGFEAFQGCDGLTSVTIPSSVDYMDYEAFDGCTSLQAVHITDLAAWCGIEFLSEFRSSSNPLSKAHHLYLNGEEVTNLVIPDGVVSIGDYAFDYCTALTSVSIPEGITTIGTCAFRRCENLTSVTIPSSLSTIGDNAFIWCFNLDTVHISDLAAWCGISFYWTANPLYYGANLYHGGEKVTDLVIPEGVASIGDGAFRGCSSLISVTIPNSINNIGEYAFEQCRGLNNVISQIEEPFEMLDNVFEMYKDEPYERYFTPATLYVPSGCKARYETTAGWKRFSKIIEDDYRPFVEEGKVWNVAAIHPDDPSEAKDGYYDILRRRGRVWNRKSYIIEGDTVIGGVTYKKLLSDGKFVCGMREEEGRVYRHGLGWNPDSETLVYDFNAKLGDVFKNDDEDNEDMMVQVKRVSQVNINGQNRRCLEMHYYDVDEKGEGYDGGFADYWIEGIGCTGSPDYPFWWDVIGNYPLLLSCYDGEECIFNIEDFNAQITKNPVDDIAYRPLVEEGKVWKVVDGDTSNPVQVVDYYYFDGDTIIDGKTCKQMMRQQYVNPDHPYYEHFPKSPFKVGTWYEEDKKVYFYDEGQQSMVLKYDFSLEANDTLKFLNIDGYIPFIIGPKQTGGIKGFKGVYRDIMICAEKEQNMHYTTWLEGVGDIEIPTRDIYYEFVWAPNIDLKNHILMSCTVGDEVIYLNDEYEDGATPEEARKKRFDFTHTIKIQPKSRIRRKNEQLLYGEYNDLKLGINLDPLDDDYQVSIADESGKVVYEKAINAGSIVGLNIDISAYAEGSYTVTVENSQESFTGMFDTQTTGIKEIGNNKEEIRTEIYNLQGQRLSSLQKGLNIVNGQKIFVKD